MTTRRSSPTPNRPSRCPRLSLSLGDRLTALPLSTLWTATN